MVYGYDTNREFIDKTQILLNKLEKKGIWDKDTLVIGLDKSVRPLAYTLRKLSKLEDGVTPDISFFNYSFHNWGLDKLPSYLKDKIGTEKISKYKRILLLDEHVAQGQSLEKTKILLKKHIFNMKNKPEIYLASLGIVVDNPSYLNKKDLIFVDDNMPNTKASLEERGIEDKYLDLPGEIQESLRVRNKEVYKKFIQNKKQLSQDIKDYIQEKQDGNKNISLGESLERALQTASIIAFFGGIFLSYQTITGNVTSVSSLIKNPLGIILFVIGILGLFFSRKIK